VRPKSNAKAHGRTRNTVVTLAPWAVRRGASNLCAPVIHYLSIDEAINCDSAHRKTLAGAREWGLGSPTYLARIEDQVCLTVRYL
jgi:hypothetical protein